MSLKNKFVAATVAIAVLVGLVVSNKPTRPQQEDVIVDKTVVQKAPKVDMTNKKVVKKITIKQSRTLLLADAFGYNAVVLADAIGLLNQESQEPIWLIMTSPGGSVISGAALISAIQASKAPVNIICRGICASMAAITLQYGSKRYVTDRTILMYHPASTGTEGDIDRIYQQVNTIQDFVAKIETEIAKRMNLTFDEYKQLSSKELWVDSDEAMTRKFVDGIVAFDIEQDGNAFTRGMIEKYERRYQDLLDKKDEDQNFYKFDIQW